MFIKNKNIKIKLEKYWKTNIYSHCIGCDFKTFEAIDEEELSCLLITLI